MNLATPSLGDIAAFEAVVSVWTVIRLYGRDADAFSLLKRVVCDGVVLFDDLTHTVPQSSCHGI